MVEVVVIVGNPLLLLRSLLMLRSCQFVVCRRRLRQCCLQPYAWNVSRSERTGFLQYWILTRPSIPMWITLASGLKTASFWPRHSWIQHRRISTTSSPGGRLGFRRGQGVCIHRAARTNLMKPPALQDPAEVVARTNLMNASAVS